MGDRRRGWIGTSVAAMLWLLVAPASGSECTVFVRAGEVPRVGIPDGRTAQTAFATINEGARAARNPGDVVCVGPGHYVEGNISPLRDGAPGGPVEYPIILRGDAGGTSTGDPPGPVRITPPVGLPPEVTPGTAFLLLGRQHIVIEGFEIQGFRDAGIQVRSSVGGSANSMHVTIRRNRLSGNRTGIHVHAGGLIIVEHNETVGNSSSGISVANCPRTDDAGFCRGEPSGPVTPIVNNNRSGGNGAHGIFLQRATGAVVQNNVVFANAFTGVNLRGVSDALVANNLIYANGQEGIAVGSGFFVPGETGEPADVASPNAILMHNTVYANGEWGVEIGNNLGASPGAALVHNIVVGNAEGRLGVGVLNERGSERLPARASTVCGYVAGYNLVADGYGPDTPRNVFDLRGDPLFADVAGADGILGGESPGLHFVDRSADDDFRLRSDSVARDAGWTTAARLGLTGSASEDGSRDDGPADLGFHYGASAEQVLLYERPAMPLYVRRSGHDANDGRSPQEAFATIRTAARRARAGVTVIVGPGEYRECNLRPPPFSGRAALVADPSGDKTGDAAGVVLVNAGRCDFVEGESGGFFVAGETGFNVASVCDLVIDGFHITGAFDDAIQIQNASDRAIVRNNVVFANSKRGINVVNSDDVRIVNNLAFANGTGGIQLSSGSRDATQCDESGARRAIIELNTAYANPNVGILVGVGVCPSTHATVRYNVTGANGDAGIEVGNNVRRAENLVGYSSRYNLLTDRLASGVPAGIGDLFLDATAPLYVDPTAIALEGDWRADRRFRLLQRGAGQALQSRAVDYGDVSAAKAGMALCSTRTDGAPDSGVIDLGYHYPSGVPSLAGDCDGDGVVTVNEIVMAVNIAVGNFDVEACPAADADGDANVGITDLILAVNGILAG